MKRAIALAAAFGLGCSFTPSRQPVDNDASFPIEDDGGGPPECAADSGFVEDAVAGIRLRRFSSAMNWDDADSECEFIDARLAKLDTDAKRAFAGTLGAGDTRTWIGLYDNGIDGWVWIDDTAAPLTSPPWQPGRPDQGAPNQGCAVQEDDDQFEDEPCSSTHAYMCECQF